MNASKDVLNLRSGYWTRCVMREKAEFMIGLFRNYSTTAASSQVYIITSEGCHWVFLFDRRFITAFFLPPTIIYMTYCCSLMHNRSLCLWPKWPDPVVGAALWSCAAVKTQLYISYKTRCKFSFLRASQNISAVCVSRDYCYWFIQVLHTKQTCGGIDWLSGDMWSSLGL